MRKKGLLKEKERKLIPWVAKIVLLGNQGIDHGTSRMQSERLPLELMPQNTFSVRKLQADLLLLGGFRDLHNLCGI